MHVQCASLIFKFIYEKKMKNTQFEYIVAVTHRVHKSTFNYIFFFV